MLTHGPFSISRLVSSLGLLPLTLLMVGGFACAVDEGAYCGEEANLCVISTEDGDYDCFHVADEAECDARFEDWRQDVYEVHYESGTSCNSLGLDRYCNCYSVGSPNYPQGHNCLSDQHHCLCM
jgi:hypothetical protein